MHYKLIVNQPFQSTASVLAAAFRFVCDSSGMDVPPVSL